MGLISKHGKDLLGKVFIWRADFAYINPGDVWFIGRTTGYQSKRFPVCRVFYKVLLSNYTSRLDGEFNLDDEVDGNSILIDDSSALGKYLELFNGTN